MTIKLYEVMGVDTTSESYFARRWWLAADSEEAIRAWLSEGWAIHLVQPMPRIGTAVSIPTACVSLFRDVAYIAHQDYLDPNGYNRELYAKQPPPPPQPLPKRRLELNL